MTLEYNLERARINAPHQSVINALKTINDRLKDLPVQKGPCDRITVNLLSDATLLGQADVKFLAKALRLNTGRIHLDSTNNTLRSVRTSRYRDSRTTDQAELNKLQRERSRVLRIYRSLPEVEELDLNLTKELVVDDITITAGHGSYLNIEIKFTFPRAGQDESPLPHMDGWWDFQINAPK